MYYWSEHVSLMYYRLEHMSVTCERHMYYRLEHVSVTCIIGQNM